jgi:hypothetical protein
MGTFRVGDIIDTRGYFLQLKFIRGQSPAELERRIGFRAGRLSQGWYLLFMLRLPTPDEYEMHGYTHFSGGMVQGHLPHASPPPVQERLLMLEQGWSAADVRRFKERQIKTFSVTGADRLAKVIPVVEHSEIEEYPPGTGIPQWKAVKPLPFLIKAALAPGQAYTGDFA